MKIKKVLFIVSLFCSFSVMTGCWDQRELNTLALVTASSFDLDANNNVIATVQIFTPQGTSSSGGSGGSGGSSGTGAQGSNLVISGKGSTISDAVNNIETRVSRHLFRGQNAVIVFGHDFAKKRLKEGLDYAARFYEIKERTLIYVAKDHGVDLLQYRPNIERNSADVMEYLTEKNANLGMSLKDVILMRLGPNKPVILPIIGVKQLRVKGNPEHMFLTLGSAIFANDRLVGTIDHHDTYGQRLIYNEFNQTVFPLHLKGHSGQVSLNIQSVKTATHSAIKDGKWIITVKVSGKGIVFENTTNQSLFKVKTEHKIEKEVNKRLRSIIKHSVKQTQHMNSDVMNFHGVFYREHPDEYNKVSHNWEDIYPRIDVKVNGHINVYDPGMIE
ncbi:Ger(x)C family spore germination protein [Terrilactibacillus tamarindi]|uniref:Ger(x)C family spore germination protein n=1 Tax=Terrilactibacillus tamarindi TaxID=2599694 RepID=UPI0018AD161D|nr:Ger(x)C family spore germination protein [Terrilactibacillus tamarindi]